jgi:hypothetical protein
MIWRHLAIQLLHLGLAIRHCHPAVLHSLDFKGSRPRYRLRDIQHLFCRILQHCRVVTVTILSGTDIQDPYIGGMKSELSCVIGLRSSLLLLLVRPSLPMPTDVFLDFAVLAFWQFQI